MEGTTELDITGYDSPQGSPRQDSVIRTEEERENLTKDKTKKKQKKEKKRLGEDEESDKVIEMEGKKKDKKKKVMEEFEDSAQSTDEPVETISKKEKKGGKEKKNRDVLTLEDSIPANESYPTDKKKNKKGKEADPLEDSIPTSEQLSSNKEKKKKKDKIPEMQLALYPMEEGAAVKNKESKEEDTQALIKENKRAGKKKEDEMGKEELQPLEENLSSTVQRRRMIGRKERVPPSPVIASGSSQEDRMNRSFKEETADREGRDVGEKVAIRAGPGRFSALSSSPSIPSENDDTSSQFIVSISGQIESCEMVGGDSLYCKYMFVHGNDWEVISGVQHGLTQYSNKTNYSSDRSLVWNFPIDISFKSSNAFGWPQLAVSLYGPDWRGPDVVQGYGSTHIPISPGRYIKYIRLYCPSHASTFHQWLGKLNGMRAEFKDLKFVTQSEGRQITRVQSNGVIKLQLNVMTKGMASFGYSEEREGQADPIVL